MTAAALPLCYACKKPFNVATCKDPNGGPPRPGAWTLCPHCGTLLIFDRALRICEPTWAEWLATPRATRALLWEMQQAILRALAKGAERPN